jgi:hypothetical protein
MTDEANGTQTATINTEHTLADLTTQKTFIAKVSISAMQAGDILELRIYDKVLTGGALEVAFFAQFFDVPTVGNAIQISIPVPSLWEWKLTLKQTAGTGRAFPWTVQSL